MSGVSVPESNSIVPFPSRFDLNFDIEVFQFYCSYSKLSSYFNIWFSLNGASQLDRIKAVLQDYTKSGFAERLVTFSFFRHHIVEAENALRQNSIKDVMDALSLVYNKPNWDPNGDLGKCLHFLKTIECSPFLSQSENELEGTLAGPSIMLL